MVYRYMYKVYFLQSLHKFIFPIRAYGTQYPSVYLYCFVIPQHDKRQTNC